MTTEGLQDTVRTKDISEVNLLVAFLTAKNAVEEISALLYRK